VTGATIARSPRTGDARQGAAAADALDEYPVLREARERLIQVATGTSPSEARLVAAVEADPSLARRILTAANRRRSGAGKVASVTSAVRLLGPAELAGLTRAVPTVDTLAPGDRWGRVPERLRLRAIMAHRACWRLADELELDRPDELVAGALLHDIGRAAMHVVVGTMGTDHPVDERGRYGTDHAELGALALRLHRLPPSLTDMVARHHDPEAEGDAAVVRAAALLSRYACGEPIPLAGTARACEAIGISRKALGALLYDLAYPLDAGRRSMGDCPLTERELEVLRHLAGGELYKQIAQSLGLSTNTVRAHLHRIYHRLGAADRAQAVLIAVQLGWISGVSL
jgi:putative nucleotidyltransferase with HDIG domain